MAVREFDGSTDALVRSVGSLTGMNYGTFAFLVKRGTADDEEQALMEIIEDGTGNAAWSPFITDDFDGDSVTWSGFASGGDTSFGPSINDTNWRLVIMRKETGVATPRFSVYDYSSSSWTHADGTDAVGDAFDPGAGATIEFGSFHGRVAVQACWSDNLPFTADASGDSAIEAAGLETAYQNWIDNSPDAAWRFNQSSTTENVVDDTGNGADQTSITGTTVITGDDPPGFDFSLGGDIELDVPFFQNSAQIFNPTVQKQSPLEVNVPHFANINQVFLATVGNQAALELDVPFLGSTVQIFVPQVVNEGDDLFEPILAGNGSYADQIFNGLVSQGFLTGSLADRERARLLSKLSLVEPQGLSLADLYRLADEENRIAGILVGI